MKGEKTMAFMGRGEVPSINFGNNSDDNNTNQNNKEREEEKLFALGRLYGRRYYIYLKEDSTYVAISVTLTLIMLITAAVAYLATYKSTIIDPIEGVKKLFLNSQLIITILLFGATVIAKIYSKSEETLIKRLMIVFGISMLTMLIFYGIKIGLDTTYTKEKFEQIYNEQNINENTETKSQINVGMNGLSVKTEKEHYIDECVKLYKIFKVKTYGTLGLNLLLNILLVFQMLRIIEISNKKVRLSNDDAIFFDEDKGD